jgi:GH24 family phage-related lysozyme (muramidase)
MRKGSIGGDVLTLQQALARHDFQVTPDGKFGGNTEWAVRAFQRRKGLLPDGVVGQKTLAAMGIAPAPKAATTFAAMGITPAAKATTVTVKPAVRHDWLSDLIAQLGSFIHGPAVSAQQLKPPVALSTAPAVQSTSKSGAEFIYRHEAQKGVSERLHWPGGASGVTLGAGYDMKERSVDEVARDLTSIGLSAAFAAQAAKGAKLQNDAAKKFAEDNKALFSLTTQQEVQLLRKILPRYERIVKGKLRIDLLPHEFDALVSFAYNPGGRFQRVADLINGGNVADAMTEIKKAVTSRGKTLKGLVRRREDEVKLYLYGQY